MFNNLLDNHYKTCEDNDLFCKYIYEYNEKNNNIYKNAQKIFRFTQHETYDEDGPLQYIYSLLIWYKTEEGYYIDLWSKEIWFDKYDDNYYRYLSTYELDNELWDSTINKEYRPYYNFYYDILYKAKILKY
jgi:hypothetical protein